MLSTKTFGGAEEEAFGKIEKEREREKKKGETGAGVRIQKHLTSRGGTLIMLKGRGTIVFSEEKIFTYLTHQRHPLGACKRPKGKWPTWGRERKGGISWPKGFLKEVK